MSSLTLLLFRLLNLVLLFAPCKFRANRTKVNFKSQLRVDLDSQNNQKIYLNFSFYLGEKLSESLADKVFTGFR